MGVLSTSYKVLGRVAPPTPGTFVSLYTVPANASAVVSTLSVCNQAATAATYNIAIRPVGATLATKHYIAFNAAIAANESIALTIGITLATSDVVSVTSSNATTSFNLFGSEITTTVTAPSYIEMYAWGAGGGGGSVGGWGYGATAGAGGAAQGVLTVTTNTAYYILIGGAGQPLGTGTTVGGGGPGNNEYGGSGGGYTGMFNNVTPSQGAALLIAGGGGGGGSSRTGVGNIGGAGGGAYGMDGTAAYNTSAYAGKGGTPTAAGANATSASTIFSGGALFGGYGTYTGGGGGGYWGGSCGGYAETATMGGGGGGSGYVNTTYVTSGILLPGSGVTPGNSTSAYRGTAGVGGAASGAGTSGIFVIRYPDLGNTAATATTGTPTYAVVNGYKTYTFTSAGSITF